VSIAEWNEEHWEELALTALLSGLPQPPSHFKEGISVPVSRWVGPDIAAVLSVEWMEEDEPSLPSSICSEVRLFLPSPQGWEPTGGSGGGGWFDPPFRRPEIEPDALLPGGIHTESGEGETASAIWGVVGSNIDAIEVVHAGENHRRKVESPTGAFVCAVRGAGRVELVAYRSTGQVAARYRFDIPTY
jgi:hypothetical protein